MTVPQGSYDAIVIGAGPVGASIAKVLTDRGKRVLILEAGRASGLTYDGWRSYVDTYRSALVKEPNSPYPPNPNAQSTYSQDILNIQKRVPVISGYQVEKGPLSFASTYLRSLGGTSLHWLGTCPRMVPNDFRMKTMYGVGVDWPLSYDELQPYYCQAEWLMGVAANKEEQGHFGIWFPEDYDYPMERIPPSYSDRVYAEGAAKAKVRFGSREYGMSVTSLAQARNSIPRRGYTLKGAVGAQHVGQRCEGNACCIPICPVQAKYSALRTLNEIDQNFFTLVTQAVVSRLLIDPGGRIGGVEYKRYESEGSSQSTLGTATATLYIVAAHAVESAKLLLASGAANSSDQVGRNLMDHPFFLTWALNPTPVGAFRGPGQTSEIPSFRDGPFRRDFAAARIDLGNWGWDIATFPPNSNVQEAAAANVFGKKLRHALSDQVPRQLRVGYVLEQLPEAANRVTIGRDFVDPIGCYRPVIHYNVSDYTRAGMVAANKISDSLFHAMGIGQANIFTHFTPQSPGYMTYRTESGQEVPLSFYGSGHHMGTHRIGISRTDSVTNRNSRSWDHENLYVVGCGGMPTVGASNPTLTAVAMALMAADDMLTQLG
ncbi:MAG: GMC family oxidoreductase [Gemmatimonadota bacterium]